MELDAALFSDQSFPSMVSIKPSDASSSASPSLSKKRDAEVITDDIEYRNVRTNTKYKTNEVEIQTEKMTGANDSEDEEEEKGPSVDQEALATWLSDIYP